MRLGWRRFPIPLTLAAALAGLALFTGCAPSPAPAREQPAASTIFTDTAIHRRICETPESSPVDLSKCVLKDQGRVVPRPTPPQLPLPRPY